MPIMSCNDSLALTHFVANPAEFPRLLTAHRQQFPNTLEIEHEGRALIAGDFQPQPTSDFVERVMRWGGGDRNIDRVRQQRTQLPIQLRVACQLGKSARIGNALDEILNIRHLGIAFASKILRFLLPDQAVILDSVIREHLGYPNTLRGYETFLAECRELLDRVRDQPYENGADGSWRVSDIEAAIYAKLKGY